MIERTVKPNKSKVSSKVSSNLGTLVDDEDQLYNIMQDVLAKGDDAGQETSLWWPDSLTLKDDIL